MNANDMAGTIISQSVEIHQLKQELIQAKTLLAKYYDKYPELEDEMESAARAAPHEHVLGGPANEAA